jgi:hypothetical protein
MLLIYCLMSSDLSRLYGLLVDWINLVDLGQDDNDPELGLRPINRRYATLERKVFGRTSGITRSTIGLQYDLTRNAIVGMRVGENKTTRAKNAFTILNKIEVPSDFDSHHQYI